MVRKRKQSPEVFSDYESFLYLMAELELIIEGGSIRWSIATANATKHRLDELRGRIDRIIAQIQNEESYGGLR